MAKRDKKALAGRVAIFLKQYKSRARTGMDSNDRQYDRKIEAIVKKMKPKDLDRLLQDDAKPGKKAKGK